MHKPFTVKQLTKKLNTIKAQDKEVLINFSYNDYDILTIEEKNDNIVLYLKHTEYRNEKDNTNG